MSLTRLVKQVRTALVFTRHNVYAQHVMIYKYGCTTCYDYMSTSSSGTTKSLYLGHIQVARLFKNALGYVSFDKRLSKMR